MCGVGQGGGSALAAEVSRRAVLVGALAAGAGATLAGLAAPRGARAQVAPDPVLDGVIDFHVHSDPERSDFFARSIDDFEAARTMGDAGARAIVLKNHYLVTSDRAWLARKVVPGIQVFGGVALNKPVGGLNQFAILTMARMKGGYGRVVWFPTFDAENHLRRFPRDDTPVRTVDEGGELLPEARECLKVIADENLVLCSGHLSAAETLTLFREAQALGVTRMLATHALMDPARFTIPQMQEVASLGGLMEHAFVGTIIGPTSLVPGLRGWANIPLPAYVEAIKQVGAQHFVLSTDLGQAENPIHHVGYKLFVLELIQAGVAREEIDAMARQNPARLLGLD
jgi:Family of unknown function (DUF6282)